MSGSNVMYELAKGNPGALSVVSRLDWTHLERLQRMKLRGSMIWVGFKDICRQDIDEFKKKVLDGSIEEAVKATRDYKYMEKEGLL